MGTPIIEENAFDGKNAHLKMIWNFYLNADFIQC